MSVLFTHICLSYILLDVVPTYSCMPYYIILYAVHIYSYNYATPTYSYNYGSPTYSIMSVLYTSICRSYILLHGGSYILLYTSPLFSYMQVLYTLIFRSYII